MFFQSYCKLTKFSYRNVTKLTQFMSMCRYCTSKPVIDVSDLAVQKYLQYVKKEYWELKTKADLNRFELTKLREYLPLVKILEERSCILDNLKNLQELSDGDSKDKDMVELVKEEREIYRDILKDVDSKLGEVLFRNEAKYAASDTILEVIPGVGGQEAMLFAREIYDMYLGYAQYKQWDCEVSQLDLTDIGGLRKASVCISGGGCYELLQMEGGVHRVQRVPSTEKGGRLHTSTVSVAILLQPSEIEVNMPDRDIRIETKRATGAGGQHVNTTDSAVRAVHLPTGLAVECQTERDQHKNKRQALRKLRALLFQQQQEQQDAQERALRKAQVGTGLRNEKIRTYNYQQDRVTDHRLGASGGTVHGLASLMQGGEVLDRLIIRLRNAIHAQKVLQHIESLRAELKHDQSIAS